MSATAENVVENSEVATVGQEQTANLRLSNQIFKSYLFRRRHGIDLMFSTEPPPRRKITRGPARVARMLALAHRLQRQIDSGEVEDRAALSRKFGITRARITQLLNLTLLAPDIQEQILALERVDGVEPTSERALRQITAEMNWQQQRCLWRGFNSTRQFSS